MSEAYSTNERAEAVMGRRLTEDEVERGVLAVDFPAELGYRCPVCRVEWDEDLAWSEYRGFLWCGQCDRDYPSALCVPLDREPDPDRPWNHAGVDAAIEVFLNCVEDAVRRASASTSQEAP